MTAAICRQVLLAGTCALLVPAAAWSHGMAARQLPKPAPAIRVLYDDGSPMAHGGVTVFAPDAPGIPYLTGETDPQGCFAFVPHTGGVWRIVVEDGLGHGASIVLDTDESQANLAAPAPGATGSGTLLGLAAILALFGAASLFGRRRQSRHARPQGGGS